MKPAYFTNSQSCVMSVIAAQFHIEDARYKSCKPIPCTKTANRKPQSWLSKKWLSTSPMRRDGLSPSTRKAYIQSENMRTEDLIRVDKEFEVQDCRFQDLKTLNRIIAFNLK